MRLLILLSAIWLQTSYAQRPATPDEIYGELFHEVQLSGIFPDSKTFPDCIPLANPEEIVRRYREINDNPAIRFSLKEFVSEYFRLPRNPEINYIQQEKNIVLHINNLWEVLKRDRDSTVKGSSLIPLPYSYIVPGGRFREIYYWDSYFTMLGLAESGRMDLIESMLDNFAWLIRNHGHIPNGNRTYYLSRSQPPFFSHMVELLAEIKGDSIYKKYHDALLEEYRFWMDGEESLKPGMAYRRVVKLRDGTILNRYWDDLDRPRQESYREDIHTAEQAVNRFVSVALFRDTIQKSKASDSIRRLVFRNLRAGAESGWDFSSRWFSDGSELQTIQTTSIIPVDLNSLLFHLETTLAHSSQLSGNKSLAKVFSVRAANRKKAVNRYCWSAMGRWFADYNWQSGLHTGEFTLAGMMPFFTGIADSSRIITAQHIVRRKFLKDGGVVTTLNQTGQQWDAPNGWAPLQWVTAMGLERYGRRTLAYTIARRWTGLNVRVFQNTGRMMEKYNVVDIGLEAGGGEYPSQDGFGWTNGVFLAFVKRYGLVISSAN